MTYNSLFFLPLCAKNSNVQNPYLMTKNSLKTKDMLAHNN